jgi:hypothetical protein
MTDRRPRTIGRIDAETWRRWQLAAAAEGRTLTDWAERHLTAAAAAIRPQKPTTGRRNRPPQP